MIDKIKKGTQWTGFMVPMYQREEIALVYFLGSIKLKNGKWKPVAWVEPLCENEKEVEKAKKAILKAISKIMKEKVWPHKKERFKFTEWKPLIDKDLKKAYS